MRNLARALVIAAILMLLPLGFHVNNATLNPNVMADGSGPTPPPPGSGNLVAPLTFIADGSGPTPPPPGSGNLVAPITFIADGSGPTPPPPGSGNLLAVSKTQAV